MICAPDRNHDDTESHEFLQTVHISIIGLWPPDAHPKSLTPVSLRASVSIG